MDDRISIENAQGTWVVRAGGAIIGESDAALSLTEDGYPEVIYFPRDDVAMAFLDESRKTTHCPAKGDARYYSIQTKSLTISDAAWSYERPYDDMDPIAGCIAFSGEGVTVEPA